MINAQSGQFTMGEATVHYEMAGSGATVVLAHAAFLDSGMFAPQWEVLAANYRVLRYDQLGYGQSSAATGPLCRRDTLRRLLDHLGIETAHFVGCSNGGQLMLDLVLGEPQRAQSLTLVGSTPSGYVIDGPPPPHMLEMFAAQQTGDVDLASELQIRIWVDGASRQPGEVDAGVRQRALAMNRRPVADKTFLIADMQPANPLDPPALERLADVPCPTLIVAGALDHPAVVRAVDVLTEGIPDARKAIMAASGHVPSFERPAAFNPLLLDFLTAQL